MAWHGADHRVRRLPAKAHLLALLFCQLSGAGSLRAIVAGLDSHAHALYHLGARPVARSTLADANAARPARLVADLFALIAFALLRAAHHDNRQIPTPLAFARLVRLNLMQRRPLEHLARPPEKPPNQAPRQDLLPLCPA